MKTFARVPVVPGPVAEIWQGEALFPMHAEISTTFHEADTDTREGDLFDGKTFSKPPVPTIDPKEAARAEIRALEATITERRLREAVLGSDGGWLKAQNDQIAALRAKLSAATQ